MCMHTRKFACPHRNTFTCMHLRRMLIDLDASCRIGESAGQKVTSSASFPPEMARYELEKASGNAEVVIASVRFEMW